MAKTRSMTITHNHDNDGGSSNAKRPKSCAPWSDLDHNVLYIVMMQLGVVDFLSFRGVCKSWRSLACKNQNKFMASSPPMSISFISSDADVKECYLEDFEGRKFKTIVPDFTGRGDCIGITCGYLIFFMRETRDFWLVNPITRHQLHFPDFPAEYCHLDRAILVFSASISKWVFVVLFKYSYVIWFSVAGERAWDHVSYDRYIRNLYAFKGRIYTQTSFFHLLELRLGDPQPELTLLITKKPNCNSLNELVSSGENFYGIGWDQDYRNMLLHELDIGEMKWVKVKACEKRMEEYVFFSSDLNRDVVAVKRELWADPRSRERYADTDNTGNIRFITAKMWYFPHDCLNVDRIDE